MADVIEITVDPAAFLSGTGRSREPTPVLSTCVAQGRGSGWYILMASCSNRAKDSPVYSTGSAPAGAPGSRTEQDTPGRLSPPGASDPALPTYRGPGGAGSQQ